MKRFISFLVVAAIGSLLALGANVLKQSNGTTLFQVESGGSQTPLTSDIDCGGFQLLNASNIVATGVTAGPVNLNNYGSDYIEIGDGAGGDIFYIDSNAKLFLTGGGTSFTVDCASQNLLAPNFDAAFHSLDVGNGSGAINNDGSIQIGSLTTLGADGHASLFSGAVSITSPGIVNGNGSGLTNLNASNLASGTVPIGQLPGITNFTKYAAGTAYTLTGTSAALTFGTTQPVLTINQAGTYLITGNVGIKYNGATYTVAQTATLKLRRTNNTAADLANGSRTTEMPVLTTFTGGDVFSMPPVVYTAANGDTVTIFGALSATPAAGSVLTDSAELVAIRLY